MAWRAANLPPEARGLPVPSPWPNSWPSLKYAKNEKICANGAASCGVDLWFFLNELARGISQAI
jgi:hypothetical protein